MEQSTDLMKIAVDAMGGDYAPGIVVEGVTRALYDYPDCEFTLVGHTGKLGFYLQKYGIADHPRLKLHHAETAVEMSDPSAISLRSKKNSSITEGARIMKAGDVEALVEILDYANKTEKPRVTRDLLDAYIDDPETDIDTLFSEVLDFLRRNNATKKVVAELQKMVDEQKAKTAKV